MDRLRSEQRPGAHGACLRLRVPPDPQEGRRVREQIIGFASTLAIPADDLSDFLTAVGEALANAVEHSEAREPIEISVGLGCDDELVATVVDRGVGFEAKGEASEGPVLPDSLAERGRGLPIMRSCSDRFSIRSAPGQGTVVVLARHINRRRLGRVAG